MKRIVIGCLFCIVFSSSSSQTLLPPASIPYIKTITYSSFHKDAFSFPGNQAALAGSKNLSAGFYGERRYLLKELSTYQLALALPVSGGNFGLQGNYFGSSAFNQSGLGLAYARSMGKVDVGAQFNYCQIRTIGYGTASAVNLEGGAILHVSDQFQTGVHIYNPTRATIGKNDQEKLPMAWSFGMGYDASDQFFIGAEIEKVEEQPVNVNAGLQYSFDRKLFARAGISSANSVFYLGAGFLWNGFRIDVAASVHPNLGITPGLLFVYDSPAKK